MKVKLKDVASFSKGQQINGDDLLPSANYAYLNGGISPSGYWNEYNIPANSIAISEGGNSCGYVNYMQSPFWCGAHCYYLFDLKISNTKYLYYALKARQDDIMKLRSGACMPNIKKSDLGEFAFEFDFDDDHQTIVVDQLEGVERMIALRKQQLSKLDELVKSRFVELFGDPNINDKGWTMGVINDIGTCVAGATPSTQNKEYWENGTIPWMSSGEVNKGRVFETDTKITQLGYDNASTKLVPSKTVVLAMAGQGKTRGTAAITEIELCTNQSLCSIVNNEKVNAEYLLYFLKLQYMELRGASTNTDGRGGLNLKIIGNYPIMIPKIELQNKFAAFVEQTDKSKFEIQKSLEKLETLKKALMQKYFG